MVNITKEQMDELKLTHSEKGKYKYYSYSAVENIKGLEKISLTELYTLLKEYKKTVIRMPIDNKIVETILELIRGKKDGYENELWWAGQIFEECERRYELWANEELVLSKEDEDIVHYLVIPDGWYESIH